MQDCLKMLTSMNPSNVPSLAAHVQYRSWGKVMEDQYVHSSWRRLFYDKHKPHVYIAFQFQLAILTKMSFFLLINFLCYFCCTFIIKCGSSIYIRGHQPPEGRGPQNQSGEGRRAAPKKRTLNSGQKIYIYN